MLIQKPAEAGDIVSIKLTDGSELIGKLVHQDATSCTISKPVIIDIRPSGPTQVALGFMPFMASANDEANLELPRSAMLTKAIKTRADVAANYRRATSSLDIASADEMSKLRP